MLKTLTLENFRSHKKYKLELEKTTVLIGLNGVGKTNVLEAISLLAHGRSFREDDKRNLINFNEEFCRVTGDDLEVFITDTPRLKTLGKIRKVGKRMTEFIGTQPAVVFSPETIDIIIGPPAMRRRFLDIMISQVDKEYLRALSAYQKVRRQRNRLLQSIAEGLAEESELEFWDLELVKHAKIISKRRLDVLWSFNKELKKLYIEISGDETSEFEIKYINKSGDDLKLKLEESRAREIAYGATIYGPHRDDLEFQLNTKNMAAFASRGELRSAILALKVAELNFLHDSMQKDKIRWEEEATPILLLDDIFSEFDKERREHLGAIILKYQTLITTTEKEHLSDDLIDNAKITEL